jgi:flagellar biosynthesis protein FliR
MLGPIVALEFMVGLVIGFAASLPMVAMQTGGLIMGQQMGLGFAMFYNPAVDDEADIVGQVLFFMALAGFLLIGGHEAMLLAVLHSFEHIPLAASPPSSASSRC